MQAFQHEASAAPCDQDCGCPPLRNEDGTTLVKPAMRRGVNEEDKVPPDKNKDEAAIPRCGECGQPHGAQHGMSTCAQRQRMQGFEDVKDSLDSLTRMIEEDDKEETIAQRQRMQASEGWKEEMMELSARMTEDGWHEETVDERAERTMRSLKIDEDKKMRATLMEMIEKGEAPRWMGGDCEEGDREGGQGQAFLLLPAQGSTAASSSATRLPITASGPPSDPPRHRVEWSPDQWDAERAKMMRRCGACKDDEHECDRECDQCWACCVYPEGHRGRHFCEHHMRPGGVRWEDMAPEEDDDDDVDKEMRKRMEARRHGDKTREILDKMMEIDKAKKEKDMNDEKDRALGTINEKAMTEIPEDDVDKEMRKRMEAKMMEIDKASSTTAICEYLCKPLKALPSRDKGSSRVQASFIPVVRVPESLSLLLTCSPV